MPGFFMPESFSCSVENCFGNITRAVPALFFFDFFLSARVTFVTAKVTKTTASNTLPCGFPVIPD